MLELAGARLTLAKRRSMSPLVAARVGTQRPADPDLLSRECVAATAPRAHWLLV